MRFIYITLILLGFCGAAKADVYSEILSTTVVLYGQGQMGSASTVVISNKTFVISCGHVVAGLRKEIINADGSKTIKWDKATVYKPIYVMGRVSKYEKGVASVIRYSPFEKEDLAILLMDEDNFTQKSVKFWNLDVIPGHGSRVITCGSYYNKFYNSISTGVISNIDIKDGEMLFDCADTTIHSGISGGPVFTESGEFIGIVVRKWAENISMFVPLRRIKSYYERVGCGFLLEGKNIPENLLEIAVE